MSNKLKEILVVDIESSENPIVYSPLGMQYPKTSISEVGIVRYIPSSGEIIVDESEDLFLYDMYGNVPKDFWGMTDYSDKHLYTFQEVSKILKEKYHSEKYTWVSWGDYDKNKFVEESAHFNHAHINYYPFGNSHINVKLLFALQQGLGRQVGMEYALKRINMPLDGIHHRGRDDAYNIAKILRYIFKEGKKCLIYLL